MIESYYPQNILHCCPRCGGTHFAPCNAKANQCADCGFVFYFNPASAVAAIIQNAKGQVLLTTRAFDPGKGLLDLPGGFVDPLESIEDALRREISEELHVTVCNARYVGSFPNRYLYKDVVYFTTDMFFLCEVDAMDSMKAADDVADFSFYTLTDDVLERIGGESIRKGLRKFVLNRDE